MEPEVQVMANNLGLDTNEMQLFQTSLAAPLLLAAHKR